MGSLKCLYKDIRLTAKYFVYLSGFDDLRFYCEFGKVRVPAHFYRSCTCLWTWAMNGHRRNSDQYSEGKHLSQNQHPQMQHLNRNKFSAFPRYRSPTAKQASLFFRYAVLPVFVLQQAFQPCGVRINNKFFVHYPAQHMIHLAAVKHQLKIRLQGWPWVCASKLAGLSCEKPHRDKLIRQTTGDWRID